tara:strand:+ start:500 stop:1915 length:1416 start_codon:yes stop_codon:yes gene_type:complete
MKILKYINKNKIGGLILIIVIIIAFGFGGFGGGFLSNNQKNIAKINNTNVTTQDFISYINRSGIARETIKENLENNIVEELLSNLISATLLNLEIDNFNIMMSEKSLSKRIKLNKNFIDENGEFQRMKYEKFLLENNTSAPLFEKRLKERELQKKLFDLIGTGTSSPNFLISKIYEIENKKLELEFINLEKFYKKKEDFNDKEIIDFINENNETLKVEYLDYKYAIINPLNLIGINEFNQTFFDKIDEIENNILNGVSFDTITTELDLKTNSKKNFRFSKNINEIEKKIYELRKNEFDIFEKDDNYIIYKIDNLKEKKPDISDIEIKNEILQLVAQKSKFDFNKNLLDKIQNKKFTNNDFIELGGNQLNSVTLNSIKDNKKFDINSVEMLYSMPKNSFTLISDEDKKIYLAKIKNFENVMFDKNSNEFNLYADKEKSFTRKNILKSYDLLLNNKYKVNINEKALSNVKNIF